MSRCAVLMVAGFFAALASGCAQWVRVESQQTQDRDKSFTVELPAGWVRYTNAPGMFVTRDGPALEAISITRTGVDKAFPKTKKVPEDAILPSELADLQIAEIKVARNAENLRVLENAPAKIGGVTGFRLETELKNERGLPIGAVSYGLIHGKNYYLLTFQAPKLFYYNTYRADFEKTVASFQLAGSS